MASMLTKILLRSYFFCNTSIVVLLLGATSTYAGGSDISSNPKLSYTAYMKYLVGLAKTNPKAPFAAMIVDTRTGKRLCQGLNDASNNPTLHGEIVAINNCVQKHSNVDWQHTALITTAEPCPMCMSAIIWTGIPVTVYGTSIPYLKKNHWDQINIRSSTVIKHASAFYHGELIGNILHNVTDELFKNGQS